MEKAQTKQQIGDDICELIGAPPFKFANGSTEPKPLFVEIVDRLALEINTEPGKPVVAEAIAEAAGLWWSTPFCSTGDTVTKFGLRQTRSAVRALIEHRPNRLNEWIVDRLRDNDVDAFLHRPASRRLDQIHLNLDGIAVELTLHCSGNACLGASDADDGAWVASTLLSMYEPDLQRPLEDNHVSLRIQAVNASPVRAASARFLCFSAAPLDSTTQDQWDERSDNASRSEIMGGDPSAVVIEARHLPVFLQLTIMSISERNGPSDLRSIADAVRAVLSDDDQAIELPVIRPIIERLLRFRYRSSDFRSRVLSAYGNGCAVCGMQLGLVHAAHIMPVASGEWNDATTNGIALCPLHHTAFDHGLLEVGGDYTAALSTSAIQRLDAGGLGAGVDILASGLPKRILLPESREDWPSQRALDRRRGYVADQLADLDENRLERFG